MYKRLFLLFLIATSTYTINAQVKTNFNNPEKIDTKGKFKINYSAAIFELAAPDLTNALAREIAEVKGGSKLFYIAEPVPVKIDVSQLASWVNVGKNSHGKFTLKSKGAKTLSINFSNFTLPKGTEMYIYNKDAEMITGVITDAENNETKVWGSSIYKGDEINIEVKLPVEEKEKLNLQITNVAYGYKNIFIEKVAGFGLSGACNINVLCPEGNNWVAERNSVVYIARSNGSALCSGAMLMNTCATNIPYVLTANHCFVGDGNVAGWRVHFQAWSATCTPNQNSDGILFNGSTLRANWDPSDFCLVQLNQTPPSNSGINYAGWSRATNASTSGVGIHHPSGDVMKISSYFTPLQRLDNTPLTISGAGSLHWRVQWPTNNGQPNGVPTSGVTEGGSSGSPLFDQNHRIVGQLAGGPSACVTNNPKQDYYGRFDNSWTGGGTNATRLSNWLDPSNSGAITTNTTNVSTFFYAIVGDNSFCTTSNNYTINNLPPGATVQWNATPQGIVTINSPNSPQTTITNNNNGEIITLTAIISNLCGGEQITISKPNIIIGAPAPTITYLDYDGCGNYVEAGVIPVPGAIRYFWNLDYGNYQFITTDPYLYLVQGVEPYPNFPLPAGQHILRALVQNTCWTSGFSYPREFTTYNCYGQMLLSVSPNPANSTTEVTLSEKADKTKKKDIQEIRIIDKMGTIKQTIRYGKGKQVVLLNVASLPFDIYTILAFDGKVWTAAKFIKNQ